MKHNKQLRITQKDFLLANRRASRAEEIEAHGKQIQFRTAIQKSKKVYDRSRLKRVVIKSDDGSYCFSGVPSICAVPDRGGDLLRGARKTPRKDGSPASLGLCPQPL